MRVLRTIILAAITVVIFFALLILLGWLDVSDDSYAKILQNIFAGNYLLISTPIFIVSLFVISNAKDAKSFLLRMLIALLIGMAYYYILAKFLISRLNG